LAVKTELARFDKKSFKTVILMKDCSNHGNAGFSRVRLSRIESPTATHKQSQLE
jgi:hypothetical protein